MNENHLRKFNKSFNDLTFLMENINDNNKYIFVFDFDLTMTMRSSNNINININSRDDVIGLFDNEDKIKLLLRILEKIKSKGYTIYLNTSAFVPQVIKILNIININIGINELIKDIIGTERPFTNYFLKEHNLENIDNTKILLALKKVFNLNEIIDRETVNKNRILFFDDSTINITIAKLNGYDNCFLIDNNSGIYGLDYLLIKLEQIIELLVIT